MKRRVNSRIVVALLAVSVGVAAAAAQPLRLSPREVEEAVLATFPSVTAARVAVEAAERELAAARTLPDPSFELGLARNTAREGPAAVTSAFGGIEWELPTPRRYRAEVAGATAGVELARAELGVVAAELRGRLRSLATELGAAQERADLLAAQQRLTADLLDLITLRVEAGESRELDRLRAVVELGQITRQLELARAEARAFAAALVRLSGGTLPRLFEVALPPPGAAPAVDPVTTAEAAVAAYPAVRAARRRLQLAEADVRVATANRTPSLVARAGRDVELDSTTTSLSVGVRLPLWNANRSQIAAARARLRQEAATLDSTTRETASRAEVLACRYLAAREAEAQSANVLLPVARESRELAEFSYRQGEASLLDALDARRAFQEAALQDLELRRSVNLLRIEIESLVGGELAALSEAAAENGRESDD